MDFDITPNEPARPKGRFSAEPPADLPPDPVDQPSGSVEPPAEAVVAPYAGAAPPPQATPVAAKGRFAGDPVITVPHPVGPGPMAEGHGPDEDRERQPWWVWALIVAVVVLGMIAVAATFWPKGDDSGSAAVPTTLLPSDSTVGAGTTGGDPATPSATEFERLVAEISRFVEQERGLAFKEDVVVELVGDDEFLARLFEDLEEEREEIEQTEGVLRALGFLDRGDDLFEAQVDILGAGVLGFYDPETNELVVRGMEATPFVRKTIAHELVHALDDQHFELDRPELEDAFDEEGFGFQALVEGNASRIEDVYVSSLSASERARAITDELEFAGDVDFSVFPPFLLEIIVAPYALGPDLVERILDSGGQAALDAAFADPPDTSEQVVDPSRYVVREERIDVPAPPADGTIFEEGVFGQLVLLLLLSNELPQTVAFDAAIGWGGDWYVAWEEANRTCIRVDFVGDTGRDSEEMGEALGRWSEAHGNGTTVEQVEGRHRLTACS